MKYFCNWQEHRQFNGIEASRKAGMKVIGVATTHPAEKLGHTDYVICNFKDMDLHILSGIWNK